MNSKLKTVRKGYPRNIPFALGVDRLHNNIFANGDLMETQNKPKITLGGTDASWDKLASKQYGAKYGEPGFTMKDYKQSTGGLFGLSKENNPFSKGNLMGTFSKLGLSNIAKGAAGGLMAAGAGMLGGLANSAISGGLSSGVGSAVSKYGSTIGSAVGAVNPVAGAIVSVGSLVLGGLANRFFGTKVDQAKLAAANKGTAAYNSFVSNASNFDAIKGITAQANVQDAYSGGVFTSGAAARKNEELRRQRADARDWAFRGVENNINNLVKDQMNNALANYAALGGPFDTINPSSAIGYSLYTDKYVEDMSRNNNKSTTNMFAGTPNAIYAFGGNLFGNGGFEGNIGTNSSDWSTGLTHIDTGGSHEENAYDGVQVGVDNLNTPNLVEEGEVIYDDYVFSNRLRVPNYKKKYKKKQEAPYEAQVLWNYSDNTFAEAAKKIEKKSGAADRPTDAIAQRGMEAELSVLRDVQEKEREKEKLKEMLEAIDNMTPEEFAMLQQQMQVSQELQAQLEVMSQQQLMIPQGMEYMLQPIEEQQPIAALGGLLNTPDKKFFYDGGWTDYLKELQKYGITPEQYIAYLNSVTTSENPVTLETIGDDNFGKNNVADEVLNKIDTIVKQYNRRAKKQGIKADDLKGVIKTQYNRELNQAIQRGLINADYDVSQDTELTFNNSSVSNAKNRQQAYNNAVTYNDLIARGGKDVELDEQGRPIWESMAGLSKIDNSAEDFYTNLGDLNEEALNNRGIYNYISSNPSSIADKDNLKLYGWQLGEDGNYTVNKTLVSPNEASRTAGNSKGTYKPSDLGDLTYGADGYRDALSNIQNNLAYKDQTSYVTLAITDAKGDYSKLPTDIQNYLEYLDANTGNRESKLLVRDKDGNVTGIANNASQLYDKRRNDNIYGIYHYQFDRGNNTTANRYYYKDKDKDGKDINVYISRPEGTDFTIRENPTVTTGTDGTQFNDYEVTGLNKNRTLTLLPTGEVVDVTNINDKDNWTTLDKPVLADNTDNLGYGINGITNWVDYSSSPATKTIKTDNDPFPKAPNWPYLAGLGIQAGALGYNILSPKDYSNADAMIKAASSAGNYNPIEFRPIGNYLTYRPMDIWFELNRMDANARATNRQITNNATPIGTKMAGLLASGYNNQIANGELYKKALEYNDALRKQVGEFNKDTDKFNSEGFLKADMANQDAATRARGYTLEGLKSGYAMRQAVDDAKAAAINAGINGMDNLLYNYASNDYANRMTGWRLRNNPYTISQIEGEEYKVPKGYKLVATSSKGGKLKRRKKGLSF